MIYWPAKPPGAIEDFKFDFADLLAGDTITGTPTVAATGVTKDSQSNTDSTVQVWLSGGTLGTPGIVTCTIVTDGGRTFSATAILPIGEEPVTLDMAKSQLRYEEDAVEDSLILELIQSSREHVEAYTGTKLVSAAVQMTFDRFESMGRLSRAPVQSITSVEYLDTAGVLQTLDPALYEFLNAGADPLRPAIRLAFNQSWPSVRTASDAIRVNAVVGYTVVPKPLIRAILMLVTLWFDERNPVAVDVRGNPMELPNTVEALLANYRF